MTMAFSTPARYAVCHDQVGTVERRERQQKEKRKTNTTTRGNQHYPARHTTVQLDMPSSLRGAALKRPAVLSSWLSVIGLASSLSRPPHRVSCKGDAD
ncbi:hypothetical protein CSPX01_03009 [Colletotrichum filicis]|nr:hypothetical protein CSPX01_03009 [Colletotrichum filicis]